MFKSDKLDLEYIGIYYHIQQTLGLLEIFHIKNGWGKMYMCFELAVFLLVIYLFILRKSSQMCAEIYLLICSL